MTGHSHAFVPDHGEMFPVILNQNIRNTCYHRRSGEQLVCGFQTQESVSERRREIVEHQIDIRQIMGITVRRAVKCLCLYRDKLLS